MLQEEALEGQLSVSSLYGATTYLSSNWKAPGVAVATFFPGQIKNKMVMLPVCLAVPLNSITLADGAEAVEAGTAELK